MCHIPFRGDCFTRLGLDLTHLIVQSQGAPEAKDRAGANEDTYLMGGFLSTYLQLMTQSVCCSRSSFS